MSYWNPRQEYWMEFHGIEEVFCRIHPGTKQRIKSKSLEQR